jgi:hypothetical protein
MIQNRPKRIKEAVKLHMVYISSNNDKHPVPKGARGGVVG